MILNYRGKKGRGHLLRCNMHLSLQFLIQVAGMQNSSIMIGIDKMSPKHLIGECLDMSLSVLRQIVSVYCTNNNFEFPLPNQYQLLTQNNDLLGFINYVLDPSRFDKIAETFLKDNSNYLRSFLRSWLFELKAIRNAWAHWNTGEFDMRLVYRAFDTISLIYTGFSGHPEYDLFQKIEMYRKSALQLIAQQLRVDPK